jgi:hypothetical protein
VPSFCKREEIDKREEIEMTRVGTFLFWISGSALALASCGVPITSAGYVAPDASLAAYTTFAWNQAGDRVVGDRRLENNRFFEDRLHEAIEWELSLRGIRRSESSPDLLVHHHLSLTDHELAQEVIDEAGLARTEVFAYEEGTVVVHLVDARTSRNVWLGWAQADVEPALASPQNMESWVYDLVEEMFDDWPVPVRGEAR